MFFPIHTTAVAHVEDTIAIIDRAIAESEDQIETHLAAIEQAQADITLARQRRDEFNRLIQHASPE